jgi:hypothetical protein
MNNRKKIFCFFKNIINYEGDASKFFSKKNNFIPIINSKKSVYSENKVNKKKIIIKMLIIKIILFILIFILYKLKIFFK